MKAIQLIKAFLLVGIIICLGSCTLDNAVTQTLTVRVQVELPKEFGVEYKYKGRTVRLGTQTAVTDENGIATFTQVIPDVYNISTSAEITGIEYAEMTGKTTENNNYLIAGSINNRVVTENILLQLPTLVTKKQSLLISKIYYAGTKDYKNKNYQAAQYIEFYNNSDDAVTIDGMYIGLIETESTPAYMLGKTPDYIYLKQLFRFPIGANKVVPAGSTVVITNSAIDHTANNDVDLSGADFEAYSQKANTSPEVPDLDLMYTAFPAITNMNISTSEAGVVLIKTEEDVTVWEKVYADGKSKGTQYLKTPVKYVIDGVEAMKNTTSGTPNVTNKRLYEHIDAGYTFISAVNGRNGEVVCRKVLREENGRVVLQETNNSSQDFQVLKGILPRQFK